MKMTYSLIIYTWLIFGSGILCDRKVERRQAESTCSINNDDKFFCSKDFCIDWSFVCNRHKDCPNGLDESKDMCAQFDYGTNMTMDCGRVRSNTQAISEKGNKEEMFKIAPWYVTILELINSQYLRTCGGTIIAPNLVISAADCFRQEGVQSQNILIDDGRYKIAVGKYDRNFTIMDNEVNKIMNVKKIYLNADLAVIVLANKVLLSNDVAPVCIDWSGMYNTVNGDQLEVVIQNVTASLNSEHLERNSSYIDSFTCQQLYPNIFSKYTYHKMFCVRKKSEPQYDIVENPGTGISYLYSGSYYLIGVNLSFTGIGTDENKVDIFTEIISYLHWIRGFINKYVTVNSCILPSVEGVVYSYEDSDEILPHGTLIDRYLTVNENCEVGYHNANPNRFRVCKGKGKWSSNPNKFCFKMCPPLKSDSVDIKCSYNGKDANCSNLSIPDTIARQSCKPTHRPPNGQNESPKELVCQSNGMWNDQLYSCKPYCGKVYVKKQTLVLNGEIAKVGTAPWNIGLYRFNIKKSNYEIICGGSIISPNLVVSAAHCFENEGLSSKIISINDGRYKIAVGKYDKDFAIIDSEFTKIINVKIIYLTKGYNGKIGSYFEDIAVIVLENSVAFSEGVAPVCIDWNGEYKQFNGDKGKIVGWGETEHGFSSPVLLEAFLPYIDRITCRKIYKNDFDSYVTNDKFCAGSALGQGVHRGDSGAGLCFSHTDSYYLTGVVSTKNKEVNDSIATFTEIQYHIEWIRELYNKHN